MDPYRVILALVLVLAVSCGCAQQQPDNAPAVSREEKIPAGALKMSPSTDDLPPLVHSPEYGIPFPVPGEINTAGYEDSPFFAIGRNELYFFFTPDAHIPPEKQLLDGVTGIYASKWVNGSWSRAERVLLQNPGKLALDGCEFVQGDTMWFCTAREGYTGLHWFTAEYANGAWTNWKNADFRPEFEVGELHISGDELYFHSARIGGRGKNDIWVLRRTGSVWSGPENVGAVNTEANEGMPALSPDGSELWFNREYLGSPAIFRSKRVGGEWQEPELILSQFAGEPTLDAEGNVYFVHHFFKNGTMIESDIYTSRRKS